MLHPVFELIFACPRQHKCNINLIRSNIKLLSPAMKVQPPRWLTALVIDSVAITWPLYTAYWHCSCTTLKGISFALGRVQVFSLYVVVFCVLIRSAVRWWLSYILAYSLLNNFSYSVITCSIFDPPYVHDCVNKTFPELCRDLATFDFLICISANLHVFVSIQYCLHIAWK